MKPFLLFFIICSGLVTGVLSQNPYSGAFKDINLKDQAGRKQGLWVEVVSGKEYKGIYVDDKQEGTWMGRYSSGLLMSAENYHQGIKHGMCLYIRSNGTLEKEE